MGRVQPYPVGFHFPLADVALKIPSWFSMSSQKSLVSVGVFGRYRTLALEFGLANVSMTGGIRVWAQDLLSNVAQDVTSKVEVDLIGDRLPEVLVLTVPGSVVDEVGTSARSS